MNEMRSAVVEIHPEWRDLSDTEFIACVCNELSKAQQDTLPRDLMAQNKPPFRSVLHGIVRKINHIARVVLDADRSYRFYTEIIGATLLNRPNFPSKGYWLWLGNLQLHLIESSIVSPPDNLNAGTCVNHISFELENVEEFEDCKHRLVHAGINFNEVIAPVDQHSDHPPIRQVFFQDPDGHWIEVCDCSRANDFIFGEYDENSANRMASEYFEQVMVHEHEDSTTSNSNFASF